ncbi:hypothetical protein D3C85_1243210 [compost metagenome]
MQAVVVARPILQDQRRGPQLAGRVAPGQEGRVVLGISDRDAHLLVPAVGDRRQTGIQRAAQVLQQVGQRVAEILVLAAAKAMPGHHDTAAVAAVGHVGVGQIRALAGGQQAREDGAAVRVQRGGRVGPVPLVQRGVDGLKVHDG